MKIQGQYEIPEACRGKSYSLPAEMRLDGGIIYNGLKIPKEATKVQVTTPNKYFVDLQFFGPDGKFISENYISPDDARKILSGGFKRLKPQSELPPNQKTIDDYLTKL